MMHRIPGWLSAAAVLGALAACAPERTRVVDEPAAARETTPKDYRESLDRVRNRQDPVQSLQVIEEAIRRFQAEVARLPTNLAELVQRNYLPEAKEAPAGFAFSYDPVHGNISLVAVTPEGMLRPPGGEANEARIQAMPPANLPPPP